MGLHSNIIGHSRQKEILLGSLRRERLSTSYLFAGDSGIGKRLMALEFAKTLNCLSPVTPDNDACDECHSCKKIASLKHPDIMLVEPEKNLIKIDNIREIQEFLSLSPYEGKKKVVIIDNAEYMNQAASNAFLKTLEEPPPNSVLILVTSSADTLLETIRSRCFRLNFSLLSRDETEEILRLHLPDATDTEIATLTRIAMGRPGTVLIDDIEGFFTEMEQILAEIEKGHLLHQWKDRVDIEDWLNHLLLLLRDILVLRLSPSDKDLIIHKNVEKTITRISKKVSDDYIIKLYTDLIELKSALRLNLNVSIVLQYLSTCLMRIKRQTKV